MKLGNEESKSTNELFSSLIKQLQKKRLIGIARLKIQNNQCKLVHLIPPKDEKLYLTILPIPFIEEQRDTNKLHNKITQIQPEKTDLKIA